MARLKGLEHEPPQTFEEPLPIIDEVEEEIYIPPPPPIARKHIERTLPKSSSIVVEDLTLVITKRDNEDAVITFDVTMAPLSTGEIPQVVIDEPIQLTSNGFRRGTILGCIADKMKQLYPNEFIEDPVVIVDNYATEIRKEQKKFDEFRDDVLYTLQYTFQIDTDVD